MEDRNVQGALPMVRIVERRSATRKRVSGTQIGWGEASRRMVVRHVREPAMVVDLSEKGALVIGPVSEVLAGTLLTIEVAGEVGLARVHRVTPDRTDPTRAAYGVEFVETSEKMRQAIRERIDQEQTALEWIWEHVA